MNIGVFVFDDVELLDLAGPYEVFTTASRVQARDHALNHPLNHADRALPPFAVITIGRDGGVVRARAGLRITPDATIAAHPPLDVLIVPGGVVHVPLDQRDVLAWVAAQARTVRVLASVCTGAFLLAKAGCLDGVAEHGITTHWEDVAPLRAMFPVLKVVEGPRWIDAGAVVTSAGISAGIDMSLHLVERFVGRELALRTARQMDYAWKES